MKTQTLETFLKEKFPASSGKKSYGSQLAEAIVGRSLGGASFDVPEAFDLKVEATEEEVKSAITEFYLDCGYKSSPERNVPMKHFGADASFENDYEKIFVVISPFDGYFKISVTAIKT